MAPAALDEPARAPVARRRGRPIGPAPRSPQEGGPNSKRIGLYVDTRRWLWLKRLSVERAERGLPADFTSIVLEALDEKYAKGR